MAFDGTKWFPSTATTASFTQPAIGSTVSVTCATTNFMFTNQILYIGAGGLYSVSSITSQTVVVVKNLGDSSNAAAAATVASASSVQGAGTPHIIGSTSITTEESKTGTSYGDLATVGPAVTMVTGTSVTLEFGYYAFYASGSVLGSALTSFAISGATTLAAADANGFTITTPPVATYRSSASRAINYSSVTAGLNTFTLKYRCDPAGTFSWGGRYLIVTRND